MVKLEKALKRKIFEGFKCIKKATKSPPVGCPKNQPQLSTCLTNYITYQLWGYHLGVSSPVELHMIM